MEIRKEGEMKARYSYRIYPNDIQKKALAKLFGCVRVVGNDSLGHCLQLREQGNKKPSHADWQKLFITQAKKTKEREWLKEVSNIPLQQSLNDLNQAYENFFKSCTGKRKGKLVKPPRFKSKKNRQTARFTRGGFKIGQHKVYLTKIGKVKIIWSRPLPSEPSSVTVIKDCGGRYFLSFVVETKAEPLPRNENNVGIDLGITDFATLSNGEKIKAPKPLKKNLKKLKRFQRSLSRKNKGSKRREKARLRVAKLHTKIKNVREDFLHKLSTRLARENQRIVLEDLNTAGLMKNRCLSRAISDLGWRQFRTFLEAKTEKYGRELRVIDRWEPTSQKCSCCGFRGGKLDLSIREWECLNCGAIHDRDTNAAINILVAGGHSETCPERSRRTKNGRGDKRKTTSKVAAVNEASTRSEFKPKQLTLFDLDGWESQCL
jgi:putative transposase